MGSNYGNVKACQFTYVERLATSYPLSYPKWSLQEGFSPYLFATFIEFPHCGRGANSEPAVLSELFPYPHSCPHPETGPDPLCQLHKQLHFHPPSYTPSCQPFYPHSFKVLPSFSTTSSFSSALFLVSVLLKQNFKLK